MSKQINKIEEKELSIVEQLMAENVNTPTKKRLTDEETLNYIEANYNEVSSKNGMLKRLRGEGMSISMDRLFKLYTSYAKLYELKNPKKEEPKKEEPKKEEPKKEEPKKEEAK